MGPTPHLPFNFCKARRRGGVTEFYGGRAGRAIGREGTARIGRQEGPDNGQAYAN